MKAKIKPETIENRWDILYRDYPEVYDKFASVPGKSKGKDQIFRIFNLNNKVIADIGSGSGLSTFSLSKLAKRVIGVEPEDAMMKIAVKNTKKKKIKNVEFKKGTAQKIPLKDNSVDVVIAVTCASFYNARNIERFVKEAKRILVNGGYIISVDVAPGWYGGELAPVILGRSRRQKGSDCEIARNEAFTALGFKHRDYYSVKNFGSMNNMVSTYGFIFGSKAIKYIKRHKKSKLKEKIRVYYYKVKK